ncbi:hypothetical protein TAGGR_1738 [Thermodesulfovibrio aggregans]|uniref:Uncharacterized protein n=1 Tax=Thermodesulfovibrio aggregans TaxID=86166 RepID=A0A0U9HS46_9BACT|nr:hypothetical protein [Thermodesulfovibrio aggregans]GAQ94554.1 hypothetical protein TAGGR_1738 [Thermodesulfovibrio aggregans]
MQSRLFSLSKNKNSVKNFPLHGSVTLTEFSLDRQIYYLKNKIDRVAKSLFRALKVKEPANITAREDFKI